MWTLETPPAAGAASNTTRCAISESSRRFSTRHSLFMEKLLSAAAFP
jgi:hypothetical protein